MSWYDLSETQPTRHMADTCLHAIDATPAY